MTKVLLIFALFFGLNARAGFFGSDAPANELLSGNVSVMMGMNNLQPIGFTVQQFADIYKNDKTKWEKDGANWILHVDRADKLTGQKTEMAIQLQQLGGNKVFVSKWVIDKEYLSGAVISGLLNRFQSDMIAAGIIKIETAPMKPRKPAKIGH